MLISISPKLINKHDMPGKDIGQLFKRALYYQLRFQGFLPCRLPDIKKARIRPGTRLLYYNYIHIYPMKWFCQCSTLPFFISTLGVLILANYFSFKYLKCNSLFLAYLVLQKSRNSRKLVAAKISTPKVYNFLSLLH